MDFIVAVEVHADDRIDGMDFERTFLTYNGKVTTDYKKAVKFSTELLAKKKGQQHEKKLIKKTREILKKRCKNGVAQYYWEKVYIIPYNRGKQFKQSGPNSY